VVVGENQFPIVFQYAIAFFESVDERLDKEVLIFRSLPFGNDFSGFGSQLRVKFLVLLMKTFS
jgi:hypothetical protein